MIFLNIINQIMQITWSGVELCAAAAIFVTPPPPVTMDRCATDADSM